MSLRTLIQLFFLHFVDTLSWIPPSSSSQCSLTCGICFHPIMYQSQLTRLRNSTLGPPSRLQCSYGYDKEYDCKAESKRKQQEETQDY
ncbi:hypothetical protein L1987_56847 [Smallanthus sonchifolius]|uniref:Uncharacterized protein n=1 Tax=Smallanthus sonchifolius TaxID=185202 RepID=A0ACB9DBD7_9ASTR|nr:hypothetical protein L1987_56847 [Smallanthus sonchifolius]